MVIGQLAGLTGYAACHLKADVVDQWRDTMVHLRHPIQTDFERKTPAHQDCSSVGICFCREYQEMFLIPSLQT